MWEPRLAELIGDTEWVGLMVGRKTVMRATKSNFKMGKIKGPAGHIFECEVVRMEGQEDNMATLFFRWVGPETEETKDEAARLKLERHLKKLERENDVAPSEVPAPEAELDSEEDESDELHEEAPVLAPEQVLTSQELASIQARTVPTEDPLDDDLLAGLEDL